MPPAYPRPLILAHRGASAAAPENTLAAFRRARALGADGFELDVTLTADGVPVVIHDDTVNRTTDGAGRVAGLTLAQIKQLDAGRKFAPAFAGERVPTLAEVLADSDPEAFINIELKRDPTPDRQLAARVLALLPPARRAHCLISSFYFDNLQRVKRLAPAVPVGLLYAANQPGTVLRAWLGWLPPAEAHHPHYPLINRLTLSLYRRRGQRVFAWTANTPAVIRRLIEGGVSGVITNYPEVAVQIRAAGELFTRPF